MDNEGTPQEDTVSQLARDHEPTKGGDEVGEMDASGTVVRLLVQKGVVHQVNILEPEPNQEKGAGVGLPMCIPSASNKLSTSYLCFESTNTQRWIPRIMHKSFMW